MPAASVLDALGNATRRDIVAALARGPQAVGVLAHGMSVTRPAISQHLRVLESARLVQGTRQGREHVYCLRREGFVTAQDWLDELWRQGLANFAALAEQTWKDR